MSTLFVALSSFWEPPPPRYLVPSTVNGEGCSIPNRKEVVSGSPSFIYNYSVPQEKKRKNPGAPQFHIHDTPGPQQQQPNQLGCLLRLVIITPRKTRGAIHGSM